VLEGGSKLLLGDGLEDPALLEALLGQQEAELFGLHSREEKKTA
jgi:hypothetical protein